MATKKQKRERGMQKRAKFFEEIRREGLAAQKRDREYREHKQRKAWEEQHDKAHSWRNLVKECPLCQDKLKASQEAHRKKAKESATA